MQSKMHTIRLLIWSTEGKKMPSFSIPIPSACLVLITIGLTREIHKQSQKNTKYYGCCGLLWLHLAGGRDISNQKIKM